MVRIILAFMLAFGSSGSLAQTSSLDNAEMSRMFAADQEIRREVSAIMETRKPDQELLLRMWNEDNARRTRTGELLSTGMLTTANDFYHAAFIYQHGSTAEDYLLAHTLAVAAAARGHDKAPWIAAATLDRYLQEIGQPQIYGTQTSIPEGQKPSMEPYNRDLIPDSLRTVLGVPVLASQEARLEERQEKRGGM